MTRKRLTKAAWIVVPALCVLLLIYTQRSQRKITCPEIHVEIINEMAGSFLTRQQVLDRLHDLNDTLTGRNIHDIDLSRVQKQVLGLPYVAKVDAFFTMNGVMKIRVTQRIPIVRVFDRNQASVYIANDGLIMPHTTGRKIRLPLITSDIHDSIVKLSGRNVAELDTTSMLRDAFKVAAYIRTDTLLNALIAQIHISKNKELILIPALDDHTIILGNADSLEYKFKKLITFYHKGMIRTGWNAYQTISLKYGNQVICTHEI